MESVEYSQNIAFSILSQTSQAEFWEVPCDGWVATDGEKNCRKIEENFLVILDLMDDCSVPS